MADKMRITNNIRRLRFFAGEMTQQEVRTVQAVLKAIDKAMRDE